MRLSICLLVCASLLLLAACGDESEPAPPPAQQAAPVAAEKPAHVVSGTPAADPHPAVAEAREHFTFEGKPIPPYFLADFCGGPELGDFWLYGAGARITSVRVDGLVERSNGDYSSTTLSERDGWSMCHFGKDPSGRRLGVVGYRFVGTTPSGVTVLDTLVNTGGSGTVHGVLFVVFEMEDFGVTPATRASRLVMRFAGNRDWGDRIYRDVRLEANTLVLGKPRSGIPAHGDLKGKAERIELTAPAAGSPHDAPPSPPPPAAADPSQSDAEAPPTLAEAKAAYAEADGELNAVWKRIREAWGSESERYVKLRDEQREWIKYRDYFAGEVLMRDLGIEAEQLSTRVEHYQSMTATTRERTAILRSLIDGPRPLPRTGRWIDGHGGYLQTLELPDGTLAFHVDVARGPTHHTGSFAGVAAQQGAAIRYSDEAVMPEGKEKPTVLTGTFGEDHLKIEAGNSQYYHGARAYFDATYYRVGDLDTDERKELMRQVAAFMGGDTKN